MIKGKIGRLIHAIYDDENGNLPENKFITIVEDRNSAVFMERHSGPVKDIPEDIMNGTWELLNLRADLKAVMPEGAREYDFPRIMKIANPTLNLEDYKVTFEAPEIKEVDDKLKEQSQVAAEALPQIEEMTAEEAFGMPEPTEKMNVSSRYGTFGKSESTPTTVKQKPWHPNKKFSKKKKKH